ncbi:MAG: hypothetical protein PHF79_02910 [Candidatus Pacebacteria bacterium]|nr:hypothetical protein [Candidatus Paceibacterota bacterium]
MMYGYGYGSPISVVGMLGIVTWLVVLADLILVGFWLWQNINKSK